MPLRWRRQPRNLSNCCEVVSLTPNARCVPHQNGLPLCTCARGLRLAALRSVGSHQRGGPQMLRCHPLQQLHEEQEIAWRALEAIGQPSLRAMSAVAAGKLVAPYPHEGARRRVSVFDRRQGSHPAASRTPCATTAPSPAPSRPPTARSNQPPASSAPPLRTRELMGRAWRCAALCLKYWAFSVISSLTSLHRRCRKRRLPAAAEPGSLRPCAQRASWRSHSANAVPSQQGALRQAGARLLRLRLLLREMPAQARTAQLFHSLPAFHQAAPRRAASRSSLTAVQTVELQTGR